MRKLLPLVALPFFAVPAAAQQAPCFPYEEIAAALNTEAHETPVARMLSSNGYVIEVLATADGSTFTILGIRPDMVACVLAVGEGFQFVTTTSAAVPGTNS